MTFMDEPMAKNMNFQREYAEPYDWIAQQFKDWAFTLTTAFFYYNDYDFMGEDERGLHRKAMAAFGGIAPSYHIELLDKPTIYWDFHSLLLGIQMMFSFMLVDDDQPLRLCKHCQKVFLGSRSNAAFTIIGIDQGYGNMKTANTIFPTAITAYDTAPMFKGDVLEYGGRFYRVGEGHKGFVADKSEDGDFYLLTLAAIAKELEQYRLFTANLCLAVGLPLSWVGSQRESFRQYLMQNETVSFRFNGNPFQLRIVSCKVYPQGYAAIVQQLADFDGEHLLADIGNGTMNLLYLTDSQPQENRCWTEKIGVNQCMIRAKEAVLRRFGSKISDSTVEQVLRTGTAKIDVDYLACIREVAASYAAELFAALRSYEYDPATTHLTIVGGGGQLIKHFGSYDPEQVTIVDDICAAAKGYEYMAYRQMLRG